MTQAEQSILDKKYNKIRSECTEGEWSDTDFLLKKISEIESTDISLAFRISQRVKVLSPTDENKALFEKLKKLALQENPKLIKITSQEFDETRLKTKLKESFFSIKNHSVGKKFFSSFGLFVLLPVFIFLFYQLLIASPRYESNAQLIVKEPDSMSTLDPSMAFMAGFGVPAINSEIELVKSYIYSNDMLKYLQDKVKYFDHFSDTKYDIFSRLDSDASTDARLQFYRDHVGVEIDEKSLVLTVSVQSFESEFAQLLTSTIVRRAEWFINEIGHSLARAQLQFVENEHELIQQKLKTAKSEMLAFQRKHNLLDPQTEGMAFQQITYGLESEIARKKTELDTLRNSMSEDAPAVLQIKNQLSSLTGRLMEERARLTDDSTIEKKDSDSSYSVGEIMAKYSDFKINVELALQAYTSSQVSLEKSRIEAYRQLKFLVIVESPTYPNSAKYPEVVYNVSLLLVLLLMVFGIGKIIIATVDELRQ